MGRREEEDDLYEVTASALNIRKGPGGEFDPVSTPLPQGTKLVLLEKRDRWSKVEVEEVVGDIKDIEGWVYNKYIRQI